MYACYLYLGLLKTGLTSQVFPNGDVRVGRMHERCFKDGKLLLREGSAAAALTPRGRPRNPIQACVLWPLWPLQTFKAAVFSTFWLAVLQLAHSYQRSWQKEILQLLVR